MNVEITNFILYKLQAGTTAEKDLQRWDKHMWNYPLLLTFGELQNVSWENRWKFLNTMLIIVCFIDANGMSLAHKRKEKTYGFESVLIITKDEL